jgi:hypothetical protein
VVNGHILGRQALGSKSLENALYHSRDATDCRLVEVCYTLKLTSVWVVALAYYERDRIVLMMGAEALSPNGGRL